VNFSVLILTRDEEKNIQACIDTLRFCDDIVVLDSLSRDRTKEIAQSAGCRVLEHKCEDFASQCNWAMDNIEFKHDWVFHLDADERFTQELAGECEDVIHEDLYSGYMIAGKLMFMGRWLHRSAAFPDFQMRLAKRGEIRFKQWGHGKRETGAVRGLGYLKYSYLHFPFKKGVDDWYQKHLGYAIDEARHILAGERLTDLDSGGPFSPVRMRRAWRRLLWMLPGRPLFRFLYMYILHRGFMDGPPGLRYCRMMAEFEGMIASRIGELKVDRDRGA
jgi:glycosyltransferase involved in cell wall biosynthesis